MTTERRLQERFFLNLQTRVSYKFVNDASSEAIKTVAANISSGGAFLQLDQRLPLSSRVQVEFQLRLEDLKKLKFILPLETLKSFTGTHVWVKTSGIVIRHEKCGTAVIFDRNYQLRPMMPVSDLQMSSS